MDTRTLSGEIETCLHRNKEHSEAPMGGMRNLHTDTAADDKALECVDTRSVDREEGLGEPSKWRSECRI